MLKYLTILIWKNHSYRGVMKSGTNALSLSAKTDYYPFGEPMPNKHTTDGNYRYAFQGQEKDGETGMEAFELRLWDVRK